MTSLFSKIGLGTNASKVQVVNSQPNNPNNGSKKDPAVITQQSGSTDANLKSSDSEMDKPLSSNVQVKPAKSIVGAMSPRASQPAVAPAAESPPKG
jgi:hypothetical protein